MTTLQTEIDKKFMAAQEARMSADSRWYTAAAFLFGKQWIGYDAESKRFFEGAAPSWRVRVVANMIFPTIRQLVAKVVRQDLSAVCIPYTRDEQAKSTSKVAGKIIKAVLEKNIIRKLSFEMALNIFTFGITFVKVFWDGKQKAYMPGAEGEKQDAVLTPEDDRMADEMGMPNLSEIMGQERELFQKSLEGDMEALMTGQLSPQMPAEEFAIGDVVVENLRPDFIYIDPLAESVQEARHLFLCKIRSKEYVQERYGVDVEEKDVTLPNPQQSIDNLLNTGVESTKGILVKEYWERKSSQYPNGRFIVMANDKIVKEGDNPYSDIGCDIPFEQINYFAPLNNLYSTSIVEQLIPLQKEYNRLRSDVVEHEKVMMRGKWLIPIGCNISKNSLTSEPGEKVYYDPRGGTPMAVAGTPPPAQIWGHISHVKSEFNDIAGLHEVSRGKVPSGVRSAAGIMFLQEQDDLQLSIVNSFLQEGFLGICKKIVKLARKYYKEDRLLKLTGRGSQIEIFQFKEGTLDKDDFDIFVEFGSKVPFSYVARQQFIMSLWDRGIIRDGDKILKLLEFTVADEIYQSSENDELQARIENHSMTQGQQVIAEDFEDHMVHIKIHNEFRKNPDFKQKPREMQELFREHVNYHQQFIAIQMAAMMEQQGGRPPAGMGQADKKPPPKGERAEL